MRWLLPQLLGQLLDLSFAFDLAQLPPQPNPLGLGGEQRLEERPDTRCSPDYPAPARSGFRPQCSPRWPRPGFREAARMLSASSADTIPQGGFALSALHRPAVCPVG